MNELTTKGTYKKSRPFTEWKQDKSGSSRTEKEGREIVPATAELKDCHICD
jgi:hypothetical protein